VEDQTVHAQLLFAIAEGGVHDAALVEQIVPILYLVLKLGNEF
jgi:hypothetical protein